MQRYVKNTLRQGSFAFLTRPARALVPNLLPEKPPFPYPANTLPISYLYSINTLPIFCQYSGSTPLLPPLYPSTRPFRLLGSATLRLPANKTTTGTQPIAPFQTPRMTIF